ncbi:RHS repeat-associated core domain-containing protein [Dactylosporangium sp. CA-233914]|uniref:RHS repeat-associated core domain-containing protein n=1 Tax=Dactylosporangium sp. CA-233914 TaxID=3239934 RepID=UPI003D8FE145
MARKRTTPYGEDRGVTGPSWPAVLDRGFAGGVADPTGLTHLGVREYDPTIGRFVSADMLPRLAELRNRIELVALLRCSRRRAFRRSRNASGLAGLNQLPLGSY